MDNQYIYIYIYIYSYIFFKSKGKSHTGADYCSLHSISYNIHLNFITLFSYIDSNFSVKYTFFFNYLTPDSFHHAQNSRSSLSVYIQALHHVVSSITNSHHSSLHQSSSTSSPSDSSPALLSYILSRCLSWISFISSA